MAGIAPDYIAQSPQGRAKKVLDSCLWKIKTIIRFRRGARPKYALLISIGYSQASEGWHLDGVEEDLIAVENMLMNHYGYKAQNIRILSDASSIGRYHMLPTKENIERELQPFVRPAEKADYFFMFSGHSSNREDPEVPSKESDLMEEYMIPSDGFIKNVGNDDDDSVDMDKIITDKFLNQMLVEKLEKGSRLFAILDCCHSGTLLNLVHRRCHDEGNIKGQVRRFVRQGIMQPLCRNLVKAGCFSLIEKAIKLRRGGIDSECWGLGCPKMLPSEDSRTEARVVCISACTDAQQVVNVDRGGVLIQRFVELMSADPDQRPKTYRELMSKLREASREAKIFVLKNYKRSNSLLGRLKERRGVRSDPQLSSNESLNLDSKIKI